MHRTDRPRLCLGEALTQRVVVITGACSGIGAAVAHRFLEDGDFVINFDVLRQGAPDGCVTETVDVRDWDAIATAVTDVWERHGRIDVAIANAGISRRRTVLETTADSMGDLVAVNLLGVFGLWKACARRMLTQGFGTLLATASTNGTVGYPHYADYNASKAGVVSLCRSFALELSPVVRVACISPGYVMTPMQRAEYTDQMLEQTNRRIPLGRHADPREIASAFHYLASDDAAFITGQQLVVDGGELAGGTASGHGTLTAQELSHAKAQS